MAGETGSTDHLSCTLSLCLRCRQIFIQRHTRRTEPETSQDKDVSFRAVADVLPNAQRRTLEGQTHDVAPDALAPVLEKYFAG